MRLACLLGGLLMAASPAFAWPFPTRNGEAPIVIAHRGASGHLPEHTLAAYGLAIELGADYIEPDLVFTKDGHLVARHDRFLSGSTDVADHPEFADRLRSDGGREDWFVEDFTLAEIRTLRARQAFPGRPADHDGRFGIPTFEEIIALVKGREAATGRRIGIYPETKHPAHFERFGHDYAASLVETLRRHGYEGPRAPVFIQSFEPDILRRLDRETDYRLILLLESETALDLEAAAEFADGVGPSKALLIDEQGGDTGFVARAHRLGLAVHAWTLRDDRIPPGFASPAAEYARLFALGVDGIFTDFPASGVLYRGLGRYAGEGR